MLEKRSLIAHVTMLLFVLLSYGDQTVFHPVEDVHIVTYNIPTGIVAHPFLKFNISSIPSGMTIDSVYLQVYVFEVYTGWDGDVIFWNVNSQTWIESDAHQEIWNIPTSDSIYHGSGFGAEVGWTKSVDLKQIFLRDYNAAHTCTSIKMSDYDSQAGSVIGKVDNDDTLAVGWAFVPSDGIRFYPHEHTDTTYLPNLVVYYSGTGVESPTKNLPYSKMATVEISPNPFSEYIKIRWQTVANSETRDNMKIRIHDAAGKLIRDLRCDMFNQESDVLWDGTDESKSKVPAGIYFVHLVIGEHRAAEKIVFLR